MLDSITANFSFGYLLIGAVFLFGIINGLTYYCDNLKSPLKNIPGPFYAPLTSLHLQYYFATGEIWKYVEKMHHRHGDIIRLGPRHIWVQDITAVKQCLSTIDLPKVKMYSEISRDREAPGLFGEM